MNQFFFGTEAVLLAEGATVGAMPVGEAGITAVLGYGVVFAGLMLLLAVIAVVGVFFRAIDRKKAEKAAAREPEPAPEPVGENRLAPGSAGEVKCFDVPDKDAAMIMAIVADELGKPLNELRFISIREVE